MNPVVVEPTPFGCERASEIFKQRGPFFDFSCTDMTPGEDSYVRLVSSRMPDRSSWASAFYEILNGRASEWLK